MSFSISASLNEPLVFAPFFRPQVWGGRRLAESLGKSLPTGLSIGESWELSCQPLHVSTVEAGACQGASLNDLWTNRRRDLWGQHAAPPQFPWLIKWLDCHDLLSVQVHPDDGLAHRLLNEPFGKTESWVVIHAEPTAKIYAGLKPGVSRDELATRSQDGSVANCLHSFSPRVGDCLHLPAGTVHAVGGGVVIAEIQQTSDATFRLFDWNRVDSKGNSRTLHLQQAFEAIDFQRGPVEPQVPKILADSPEGVQRELLVQCPYYQLERVTLSKPWTPVSDGLEAWMSLTGEAAVTTPTMSSPHVVRLGDTVLLPAAVKSATWKPLHPGPITLLRITRPLS